MGCQDGDRVVAGVAEHPGVHTSGAQSDSPEVKAQNKGGRTLGQVEVRRTEEEGTRQQPDPVSESTRKRTEKEAPKEEFFGKGG